MNAKNLFLGLLLVIPNLILLLVFTYRPLIDNIRLSFYNWNIASTRPATFVGLDNYIEWAQNPVSWQIVLQTAIFTVGTMSPESTLLKLGYLSEAEQTALLDNAVGDICSRFIDEHGEPCLPELEERTVAVSLQNLCAKQTRICVAGGQQKVRPLKAALGAGYVSHLVTDEDTARAVLA